MHTREIARYGGLVSRMPIYALVFMVFTLAEVAFPAPRASSASSWRCWAPSRPTPGWPCSRHRRDPGAAYMLYLYRRVIFGKLVKPPLLSIKDLSLREVALLAPLVAVTILMGVYPKAVFDVTSVSVAHLIAEHKAAVAFDRAPQIRLASRGDVR